MDTIVTEFTSFVNYDVKMLESALWYARKGWAVFPVHVPIHNEAGECIGCTCETYRQSEECRVHHPRMYLGAGGKCEQPGKCPAVRWSEKSATDPAQIRKWWGRPWRAGAVQFIPNIGLDCGKSNVLTLDADAYKESYAGADLLSMADRQTVTALTGGGGEHLAYDRQGLPYGNDTQGLPAGIDIRGAGGYVVLTPSLHKSGRRYAWESGYGPHEVPLLPIPDTLRSILDPAHKSKQARQAAAVAVTFASLSDDPPDLTCWHLSETILDMINSPAPKGQRSEHDYAVIIALAKAGAADDDIHAIFSHFPVGLAGKFAERGLDYLARTITNARADLAEEERKALECRTRLEAAREWGQTTSFAEFSTPGKVYRTDSTDTKVFDTVICAMLEAGAMTVTLGGKRLAKLAGLGSHHTALTALERCTFAFALEPSEWGLVITLKEVCFAQIAPPFSSSIVTGGQSARSKLNDYSERKATDPFLTGTSRAVKERCREASILAGGTFLEWLATVPAGLGETVLRCLAHAPEGGATIAEIVEAAGKTKGAVYRAMKRAEEMGLAHGWQEAPRKPKHYDIEPAVWQLVDELTLTLRTHGLTAERENKRLESAQQWTVKEQCEAIEAGDKATHDKLERRLTRLGNQRLKVLGHIYPERAMSDLATLALDITPKQIAESPAVKEVKLHRRQENREWVISEGRNLRGQGLPQQEIIRMLHYAAAAD